MIAFRRYTFVLDIVKVYDLKTGAELLDGHSASLKECWHFKSHLGKAAFS